MNARSCLARCRKPLLTLLLLAAAYTLFQHLPPENPYVQIVRQGPRSVDLLRQMPDWRPRSAISPDGSRLAIAEWSRGLRLWDLRSQRAIFLDVGKGLGGNVWQVAFSPDGRLLAAGDRFGRVHLWEAPTGRAVKVMSAGFPRCMALAFSPDGRVLASACYWGQQDSQVALFDVAAGRPARTLRWRGTQPYRITFSPDGKTLACQAYRRHVCSHLCVDQHERTAPRPYTEARLFHVSTGRQMACLPVRDGDLAGCAFSPDGARIAALSFGNPVKVRVWGAHTGRAIWARPCSQPARDMLPHNMLTLSSDAVAWSPDGRTLAAFRSPDTVELWDPVAGKPRAVLRGQGGALLAFGFSRDGSLVATREQQRFPAPFLTPGRARLWDATTGRPVALSARTRWEEFPPAIAHPFYAGDRRITVYAPADGAERFTLYPLTVANARW